MKLALVVKEVPPSFAGAGLRAVRMASRFSERGHSVAVLSATSNAEPRPGVEHREVCLPLRGRLPSPTAEAVLASPATFLSAQRALAGVDVVHLVQSTSFFSTLVYLAAEAMDLPVVAGMTLMGSDDPEAVRQKPLGRLRVRPYDRAEAIVAISPALAEAARQYGISADRLHVIPNPVDTGRFRPPAPGEREALRRDLLGGDDGDHILAVGILHTRKGFDRVISAFAATSPRGERPLRLAVVGPDDKDAQSRAHAAELRALAGRLGVADRVRFTGRVENVEAWMRAADVMAFASTHEGFGNVLAEGAASGLPIVAWDLPGITDFVLEGAAHQIVHSEAEMAKAFGEALDRGRCADPDLSRLAPEAVLAQYEALYESVAS